MNMNTDELKNYRKMEKAKRINSLYDEFLENNSVCLFKETEAIEFAKYLIKHHAIFKFYYKIFIHPGNLGMWEPYKEEEAWIFENSELNI